MKKTITLLTILTLLLGCTKENSNSTVTPQNNKLSFTPYYLPNKDGIIIASASRIILHTTDFVNLSANIYGVDGAIISNPSLTWNSEDNKVVTASNGNITAVSLGDTRVKISDGVHSDGYVNITVVSDTTNIPNEVANIVFDNYLNPLLPNKLKGNNLILGVESLNRTEDCINKFTMLIVDEIVSVLKQKVNFTYDFAKDISFLAPIEAIRHAVRKAGMTFTKMPTLSLLKKT